MDAALAEAFESNRERLKRLAYRMLGSVSEADDVLQDAWLRWQRAGHDAIDPAAWLVRTTTRLCIDRLRTARAERQAYRGPWLPEPLIEPLDDDPVEKAEEVSVAFLLALERLSPLERAVFLLHDVFEEDYGKVAAILERTEVVVRQLASRAREHLKQNRPRFTVDQDRAMKLAAAFASASATLDTRALSELLAEDAMLITDGGGRRAAALRIVVGRDDIIRLFERIRWRHGEVVAQRVEAVRINGHPGLLLHMPDGLRTVALEPGHDGRIAAVYMMLNPEKLRHLAAP